MCECIKAVLYSIFSKVSCRILIAELHIFIFVFSHVAGRLLRRLREHINSSCLLEI